MAGTARKIIHVDMDAFFAAVEQRDDPALRGRPVVVGGSPDGRGVVCTASYEARRFGIHSAMPCARVPRLCPDAVFVRPDFRKYQAVSGEVHAIFHEFADLVEPLSLDEAYLDVTRSRAGVPSATRIAQEIRRRILETTGLTASAGVSSTKFVAKVASDMHKPDGLTVVLPEAVPAFVAKLPVRKVPGIGEVTEAACERRGIRVCADFLRHTEEQLREWFGKSGPWFQNLARGIDPRPVVSEWVRRSCGIEDTFAHDLLTRAEIEPELARLAAGLEARMVEAEARGRTVTLKVRYDDFVTVTRSRTLGYHVREESELRALAHELLGETEAGTRPVRLLGLAVSALDTEQEAEQLLFPFYEQALRAGLAPRPTASGDGDP